MAPKGMVDGTVYKTKGGIPLVNGTSYKVEKGKVLVDGTAYDISFLLSPNVLDLWNSDLGNNVDSNSWQYTFVDITCITYANGYWVIGGVNYDYGAACYARIAYSASLDGSWTIKDLWSETRSPDKTAYRDCSRINCIEYANGYWVVGGNRDEDKKACIAYATSLKGTWTVEDIWARDYSGTRVNCIKYANGYWVAGGTAGNYSAINETYIAYATTPSGSWTVKQIWSDRAADITCIEHADGCWVVGGQSKYGGHDSEYGWLPYGYSGCIAYATTPSDLWVDKTIWPASGKGDQCWINCITYVDGYWVAGGYRYIDDEGIWYAAIAYTSSLGGTWATKNLWNSGSWYRGSDITGITYHNGQWVVCGNCYDGTYGYAKIAFTTSPAGTWKLNNIWYSNDKENIARCIYGGKDYFVSAGRYKNGTIYNARLAYAPDPEELGETS